MKKTFLFVFLFLVNQIFAQRDLTIQEATMEQYRSFYPKSMIAVQWQTDTDLTYLSDDYKSILKRNHENNWEPQVYIQLSDIQEAINSKYSNNDIDLKYFPKYKWKNNSVLSLEISDKENLFFLDYDIQSKRIVSSISIDRNAEAPIISRNNDFVAWLKDNNIIITNVDGKVIEVTSDTTNNFLNGSKNTHRNEFGINEGMWWNPKQDQLLYYRKDQSMVSDYPLVDFESRVATVKNIKYPMAGMSSEHVSLVIYDVSTGNKTTLQTGEPLDQYLTMVTWDPSGNYIYTGILNREQNEIKLNKYNATTGAFEKTLFVENSSTYAEPSHSLFFNPKKDNEFIYLSEKDGYRQAYLYNTNGNLIKKLGYKDVVVTDIIGFDNEGRNLYYIGTANQGLDRLLYKVSLKNGKTEILTPLSGTHKVALNPSKSIFLDQFSDIETPNVVSIETIKNKISKELMRANDPYKGIINMPKMELVTLTAADGKTPLNGRIIYPTNFDINKRYPVMVYVYGGPHAQLIQNNWMAGSSLFFHYMAQQGYIVFTVDNRGSNNRGRDFEHIIHRQLGQIEMADQMKGIAFLKTKPFVDQEKIGVYGWSFGGFMTTSLSIHYPDIFKVGVAGGPVMDWKYYEVMYGERYMDTPQENPEGYEKTSLINKANLLKNKLLIIHGAQDPVVVQQHSMEFIEACIKAGKQVDYFLYPTHEHNVMGKDRVHLNQMIANYFFYHLAAPRK